MDVTGSTEHVVTTSKVKRKFFQWATKWFYGPVEQPTVKPDVPGIVCLLQALGCQLREYERQDIQNLDPNSMRIVLECGSSRMRAVMELDGIQCRCSTSGTSSEASFWSVSGTGPPGSCESINRFEETGSNLLPVVSKDDRSLIRDVLHRLLETVNLVGDVNHNLNTTIDLSSGKGDDMTSPMMRSFTQPEFNRLKEDLGQIFQSPPLGSLDKKTSLSVQNLGNLPSRAPTPERSPGQALNRQNTWDLDTKMETEPRPSPPKISSSPVILESLCSYVSQISLQSDDDNVNQNVNPNLSLAECLRRAKLYIEKAQNSYEGAFSGLTDDEIFAKPLPLKTRASLGASTTRSVFSSPGKLSATSIPAQRPIVRHSCTPTESSKTTGVLKSSPSQLPARRRTIGTLAPVTSLRTSTLRKSGGKASPSTSSASSVSSGDSKATVKWSPGGAKSALSQPKAESSRPVLVNRSLSAIQRTGTRIVSPLVRGSTVMNPSVNSPGTSSPSATRRSLPQPTKFSLAKREK